MNGSHTGEVSSVWINKLESPRAYIGIGALSGGEDGHVFAWDLDKGEIVHDYTLCQGVAVTHIKCDSKDRAIAITADGKVFILFEGAEEFALLGQFPVSMNERGRSYSRLSFSKWILTAILQYMPMTLEYFDLKFLMIRLILKLMSL
jgi:hypothetical protein